MDKPWETEPNELSWSYRGVKCYMIRHPRQGHWCGYVAIPKGHPLYGKHYSDSLPKRLLPFFRKILKGKGGKRSPIDIFCFDKNNPTCGFLFNVHGGITFSREIDKEFRYGFDCSHADDFSPFVDYHSEGDIYRTQEYVVKETESLARQLISFGRVA